MGEEGSEPSGIVGGESSLSSGSANRPPPEQEEPTHHQLQPQEEEEGISSTSWKSYISEDLPRTVVQSTDSALRSARSLQHTSQTHLRTLRDFIPEIGSHYRTYEDAFFSRVKDGLMDAKKHPFVAGGVAVTTSLLLMRDLQKLEGTTCLGHHRKMCNLFYPSTIQQSKSNYHKISGSRRFLFHHTFGRLQSEEAQFVRAEKHVKELNLSVDLMKNESRKLLERAALAEKDMRHGQSELMNAGTQIQRLARSVYKAEVQSSNLMDGLRELPGREALRLRAEVASLASHLRQERVAMNRRVLKISELGLPV